MSCEPRECRKRLLVVDDEEAILFALARTLAGPGIAVDTASNLPEALECLRKLTYDAVVADLRLSGADTLEGFEVVRTAKELQPNAKVVVVTAYMSTENRKRAFDEKADYCMEKPVPPQELRKVLISLGAY
jgi:CheY-like chemotaxis protein